jgi:NAD(P)-dependent dehydrogenase (short-subunit alcohol dehydrogenase family)
LTVAADISDDKAVASLYEKVAAVYGHADVLINNAGIFKAEGTLKDVDPSVWWEDFVCSYLHPSHFIKHLALTREKSLSTLEELSA